MNVGPARAPPPPPTHPAIPAYTVLVVGPPRAGKSSLTRLFLDTAPISPHATPAQRESLVRFLRADKAFPECEIEVVWDGERVLLRLIDSPPLNYAPGAEDELERTLADIIALVEDRYIDGAREEAQSTVSESHIHLCLYVLDPASIVTRYPPSPSYRRPDPLPPKLPANEITVIHKLSTRVNVLPVLGRSDHVTLDQLLTLKHAVRKNLAEAGLGFGIFDEKGDGGIAPTAIPSRQHPRPPHSPRPRIKQDPTHSPKMDVDEEKPRQESHVRTSHSRSPTPPATETVPLLPFAFFAPEGPPRDEHYDISENDSGLDSLKGRFVREYRWGALDCLDRRHSDFVTLRKAVMDCRKELKAYTKDFLYERFKTDFLLMTQRRQRGASSASSHPPPPPAHTSPRIHVSHPRERERGDRPPVSPLDGHPPRGGHSPLERPRLPLHETRLPLPPHALPPPRHALSHPHHPHTLSPHHAHAQVSPRTRSLHVLPPPFPTSPVPVSSVVATTPGGRLPPMAIGVQSLLNHAEREDRERDREMARERERDRAERERERDAQMPGTPVQVQVPPQVGAQMMVQMPLTVNGRKRKSTMACNFCRSRKLKCDGIRPACAQCIKRSNSCDYQSHVHPVPGSQGAAQVQVVQVSQPVPPHPSPQQGPQQNPPPQQLSPHAPPHPLTHSPQQHSTSTWRYNPSAPNPTSSSASNPAPGTMLKHPHHAPHLQARHASSNAARDSDSAVDELDDDGASELEGPGVGSGSHNNAINRSPRSAPEDYRGAPQQPRKRVSVDMLIAETLEGAGAASNSSKDAQQGQQGVPDRQVPSVPGGGQWYEMGGMGVIDVGSEGDKKKRLNRQSANYGSKAVACVHCRARKTRCDAARPACGNCARRSLACSYNHTQPSQPRSKGKKAAAAANAAGTGGSSGVSNGATSPTTAGSATVSTVKGDSSGSGSSTPANVQAALPNTNANSNATSNAPPSSSSNVPVPPSASAYWNRGPAHPLSPPSRERIDREREREQRFLEERESAERERPGPLPPMRTERERGDRESPNIPPIATLPQPVTRSTSPASSASAVTVRYGGSAAYGHSQHTHHPHAHGHHQHAHGMNGMANGHGRSRSASGSSASDMHAVSVSVGVGMKRKTPESHGEVREREREREVVESAQKKRKWMEGSEAGQVQPQPLEVRVQ
ncbi:hypothetical protein M422DRAFT_240615 [Sphaerobolus stellatus SS14]|nr:hypothetical protein M422DRAFT_240615 [Sphaerobolus stellatus SS14]